MRARAVSNSFLTCVGPKWMWRAAVLTWARPNTAYITAKSTPSSAIAVPRRVCGCSAATPRLGAVIAQIAAQARGGVGPRLGPLPIALGFPGDTIASFRMCWHARGKRGGLARLAALRGCPSRICSCALVIEMSCCRVTLQHGLPTVDKPADNRQRGDDNQDCHFRLSSRSRVSTWVAPATLATSKVSVPKS
jgi:hypothetical protein